MGRLFRRRSAITIYAKDVVFANLILDYNVEQLFAGNSIGGHFVATDVTGGSAPSIRPFRAQNLTRMRQIPRKPFCFPNKRPGTN